MPHTRRPFTAILRLHRDQCGSISIVTVFVVILLTMLLGMIVNVGSQTDGKVRMQNAADAAAYSGGATIARGMNSLAFTNHLMGDVFALTAFLREARDGNARSYVPQILAAWQRIAPVFAASSIPKFHDLGTAIAQKVPMEQALVDTWSEWNAATSEQVLPTLEEILREEMIPDYQRSVVEAFPDIAQATANEVARRHGGPAGGQGEMLGVLWRTSGEPVGWASEFLSPTLPVVDPIFAQWTGEPEFTATAVRQRRQLANRYLGQWNAEATRLFALEAKMCQFHRLWSSFTNGQLKNLLDEYPDSNLPQVIRTTRDEVVDANAHLLDHFTFLAVVYRRPVPQMLPGLFRTPMENDTLAYAAARVFVPRRRLAWFRWSTDWSAPRMAYGGVPGNFLVETLDDEPPPTGSPGQRWVVGREGASTGWDVLNQRWSCGLVPAAMPSLGDILQSSPPLWYADGQPVTPPNLGGVDGAQIQEISPH